MTYFNTPTNSIHIITSKELCLLYKPGFKLVPLLENHEFPQKWGAIYDNPHYWQISDFNDPTVDAIFLNCEHPAVCSQFKNIASTVGKTHLKDSEGKDLYLQVLDCDSEIVYNALIKRTLASLLPEKNNAKLCRSPSL